MNELDNYKEKARQYFSEIKSKQYGAFGDGYGTAIDMVCRQLAKLRAGGEKG